MKSLGIYSGYKKNIIANSAAMDKIASGKKINSAKDNPLKIEQSENFKMQIRALEMSNKNLQDSYLWCKLLIVPWILSVKH